jgi:hypothetical protein
MEGCPDSDVNVLYMVLSAMLGTVMFLTYQVVKVLFESSHKKKTMTKKNKLKDAEFRDLQVELYGADVLLKDGLSGTNHSSSSRGNRPTTKGFDVEANKISKGVDNGEAFA